MDLTFKTESGIFNYRVCAVILHDGMILATKDQNSPYFYLPGGRVKLHEAAEDAIVREVREELGIKPKDFRPLWLNQGFFTEDVTGARFHELCLYYLVDISETDLLSKGHQFTVIESGRPHYYEWIPLSRLESEYLYPLFIKKKIYDLPEHLTVLTEYES